MCGILSTAGVKARIMYGKNYKRSWKNHGISRAQESIIVII